VGEAAPPRIVWAPQPGPQELFVTSPIFEVVYGGARGGGKTDAALGDWALHAKRYKQDAKGLFVRRTRIALEPTIERAKAIFQPLGAVWHEQKSMFRWPGGAVLYFRYLDNDADADGYQGHDYTRVYVEELTQFPSPRPVDKLKATLRSAAGVPCGFRATCNPGGPGHSWVKARYIDAGAYRIITENGLQRVFIPARLSDNPKLDESDPQYRARLAQSGSAALVKAWLEGDWNIIEGAFFDNWREERNVARPLPLPPDWTRFTSLDWGSAKPFSVGWWTIASDAFEATTPGGQALFIPRGALVRYREWYGSNGKPNEGLKLTAEKVAEGILERERQAEDRIAYRVADPAIFNSDGGPSIAERFFSERVIWKRADNARVPKAGALGGWDQMRARVWGDVDVDDQGRLVRDGGPGLVVFSTCRDFLRTVPVLQHDPNRAEDVDTDAEDHAADEARYACMSRPYVRETKAKPRPEARTLDTVTFEEVLEHHKRRREAAV
jgi:hypothetical protein